VVTLPQAIAWLGMREIRKHRFRLSRSRARYFASTYFRTEMTDLWRESVITALFAQEIARLKRRNRRVGLSCGLLHRAGMAVHPAQRRRRGSSSTGSRRKPAGHAARGTP
jgi:HD-like signal output (HDOD) protein